jgi:hypothetical protein
MERKPGVKCYFEKVLTQLVPPGCRVFPSARPVDKRSILGKSKYESAVEYVCRCQRTEKTCVLRRAQRCLRGFELAVAVAAPEPEPHTKLRLGLARIQGWS